MSLTLNITEAQSINLIYNLKYNLFLNLYYKMETIRMNIELDELQFIINDLKDQIQELRDEKNLIDEKYHRLVDKIIEAKTRKKAAELVNQMTKEQEEIIGVFRMQH